MRVMYLYWAHLKEPDEEHGETDRLHDAGVVLHQSLTAASPPQVQLLAQLVKVKMCRSVADLLLDAGPRG